MPKLQEKRDPTSGEDRWYIPKPSENPRNERKQKKKGTSDVISGNGNLKVMIFL